MTERVIVPKRCAQCFEPGDKKCSRCKEVWYCSLTCQKKHWSVSHSLMCGKVRKPLVPGADTGASLPLPTDWLFDPTKTGQLFVAKVPNLTVGLINSGNTCFANAVLQCLTSTRALLNYVTSQMHSGCALRANGKFCLMCIIENHVLLVGRAKEPMLPQTILANLTQINKEFSHGNQEDSAEFLKSVLRGLHMSALRLRALEERKVINERTEHTTLVHQLFGGYLRSQLRCPDCDHCNNTYEAFSDISLEIEERVTDSLEEMLQSFTKIERLDAENKYKCDKCGKFTRAEKRITVHEPSNYLVIHLKRFKLGLFGKINRAISFKPDLSLQPFMSAPLEQNNYRLYAVIVHLDLFNISSFGHYICYVVDKEDRSVWYRIDDTKVVQVSVKEVLQLKAYILFYERVEPFIHSPEVAAPSDAPAGPSLCIAGCGFFGSPKTSDMCSQCFAREGPQPVRKSNPTPKVAPKQVSASKLESPIAPKKTCVPNQTEAVTTSAPQSIVNPIPSEPCVRSATSTATLPEPNESPHTNTTTIHIPTAAPDALETVPSNSSLGNNSVSSSEASVPPSSAAGASSVAVPLTSSPAAPSSLPVVASLPEVRPSSPVVVPAVAASLKTNKLQKTNSSKLAMSTKKTPLDNQKIGRNDKCPCGSGLKYKQCHAK